MAEPRLITEQLTSEEAVAFAKAGAWQHMSPADRGLLQLRQQFLCMDFSAFHEGITELLGRSVWTHEFADPEALWREYQGIDPQPDMAGIIAKLEKYQKPILVVTA